MSTEKALGEVAYLAYYDAVSQGGGTGGQDAWSHTSPLFRESWEAAAQAVIAHNTPTSGIAMTPVESSTIAAIGHHAPTSTLRVAFIRGGVYDYAGVSPYTYAAFMNAKSKGTYLHNHIKPHYTATKMAPEQLTPTPTDTDTETCAHASGDLHGAQWAIFGAPGDPCVYACTDHLGHVCRRVLVTSLVLRVVPLTHDVALREDAPMSIRELLESEG